MLLNNFNPDSKKRTKRVMLRENYRKIGKKNTYKWKPIEEWNKELYPFGANMIEWVLLAGEGLDQVMNTEIGKFEIFITPNHPEDTGVISIGVVYHEYPESGGMGVIDLEYKVVDR